LVAVVVVEVVAAVEELVVAEVVYIHPSFELFK
jgi:hypothetical protein